MKRIIACVILLVFVLSLAGCSNGTANVDTVSSSDDDTNVTYLDEKLTNCLANPSTKYDSNLALICANLSEKIEDVHRNNNVNEIISEYENKGFKRENIYTLPGYNKADYYFSLACANNVLINGTNYNVLFITARGTGSDNLVEQIGDFSSEVVPFEKGYYAYEDCKYFCDKIMNQIEGQAGYLEDYSFLKEAPLKIVITGHSLGGAAANLVAAKINMGIGGNNWWSNITTKEDVYCYTYGAISSINKEKVYNGFENIHNIYNYYDSFGPKQPNPLQLTRNNSFYKKFGHIEFFGNSQEWKDAYNDTKWLESKQHIMSTYIDGITNTKTGEVDKLSSGLITCNDKHDDSNDEKKEEVKEEVKDTTDNTNNGFNLVGLWSTPNEDCAMEFDEDGYFCIDWGYGSLEEGVYEIGEATSDKSFIINTDSTGHLKLMSLIYGVTSDSYHFEILVKNDDNIYLVQVYDEYTAETSPCKLPLERIE